MINACFIKHFQFHLTHSIFFCFDYHTFFSSLLPCVSVHTLSKTIQGTMTSDVSGFDFDQNWICVM